MHHSSIGVVEFLLPHILMCEGSKKDFYDHKRKLVPTHSIIGGWSCGNAHRPTGGALSDVMRVKVSMMKVGMMMLNDEAPIVETTAVYYVFEITD